MAWPPVVVVVSTHNTRAKPFLIPDQFFHATLHARSYLGTSRPFPELSYFLSFS
jgi:hypothetical protein